MAKALAKGSRITGTQRETLAGQYAKRYAAGDSIRKIADDAGRSFGFVHGVLKESGTALRGRGGATRGTKKAAPRGQEVDGQEGDQGDGSGEVGQHITGQDDGQEGRSEVDHRQEVDDEADGGQVRAGEIDREDGGEQVGGRRRPGPPRRPPPRPRRSRPRRRRRPPRRRPRRPRRRRLRPPSRRRPRPARPRRRPRPTAGLPSEGPPPRRRPRSAESVLRRRSPGLRSGGRTEWRPFFARSLLRVADTIRSRSVDR